MKYEETANDILQCYCTRDWTPEENIKKLACDCTSYLSQCIGSGYNESCYLARGGCTKGELVKACNNLIDHTILPFMVLCRIPEIQCNQTVDVYCRNNLAFDNLTICRIEYDRACHGDPGFLSAVLENEILEEELNFTI